MHKGQTQNGQIVIEYVLILTLAVTLALLLSSSLVSRSSESPGVITKKWRSIIEFIAADIPER